MPIDANEKPRVPKQIKKIIENRQKGFEEKKKKKIRNFNKEANLRTKFKHDNWDAEDPDVKKDEKDEILLAHPFVKHETRVHHHLKTRSFAPNAKSEKPNTLVPAIEMPHGGQSYNPSVEEHQEILWKAAMIEIEKEKQAKKLERSLSGMFTTADKAPTYRDYLEEMTQGIPELGGKVEESDEGEDNAEDEAEEAGFSKETKPKTKQQRRKERLRKEKQSLKLKAKKQFCHELPLAFLIIVKK